MSKRYPSHRGTYRFAAVIEWLWYLNIALACAAIFCIVGTILQAIPS